MPEIYEVKRIGDYLRQAGIEGKRICAVKVHRGGEKIIRLFSPKEIVGQSILQIVTKAKYTFFLLSSSIMIWHYRFTGLPGVEGRSYQGLLEPIFQLPTSLQSSFCRLTFVLESGLLLHLFDQRCLATIRLDTHSHSLSEVTEYVNLAKDFIEAPFPDYSTWQKGVEKRRRAIKLELQDQRTFPSGIGNYLACEILSYAKLSPWKQSNALSKKEYRELSLAVETVKKFSNRYVDYHWFSVFNRTYCKRCTNIVMRKRQSPSKGSQTTHFCPHCQGVSI